MTDVAPPEATDPYLPVEEVARRLDVPLGLLLRRVQAGDLPSRCEMGPEGVHYSLRMSDLGAAASRRDAAAENGAGSDPATHANVVGTPRGWPGVVSTTARQELASLGIDPRELVAGLLDRWERTLEQRIYAEQRLRFERELNTRQNLVKQLQMELRTSRAEQAAALAERDRRLAEQERRAVQLQNELTTAREAASRRRGWRLGR